MKKLLLFGILALSLTATTMVANAKDLAKGSVYHLHTVCAIRDGHKFYYASDKRPIGIIRKGNVAIQLVGNLWYARSPNTRLASINSCHSSQSNSAVGPKRQCVVTLGADGNSHQNWPIGNPAMVGDHPVLGGGSITISMQGEVKLAGGAKISRTHKC